MKKNMFKVMALSLAMATLSTTAAFAAGWGKVGSEWYYYQEDGTVARNTWINTLVSNDESGELTQCYGEHYESDERHPYGGSRQCQEPSPYAHELQRFL